MKFSQEAINAAIAANAPAGMWVGKPAATVAPNISSTVQAEPTASSAMPIVIPVPRSRIMYVYDCEHANLIARADAADANALKFEQCADVMSVSRKEAIEAGCSINTLSGTALLYAQTALASVRPLRTEEDRLRGNARMLRLEAQNMRHQACAIEHRILSAAIKPRVVFASNGRSGSGDDA